MVINCFWNGLLLKVVSLIPCWRYITITNLHTPWPGFEPVKNVGSDYVVFNKQEMEPFALLSILQTPVSRLNWETKNFTGWLLKKTLNKGNQFKILNGTSPMLQVKTINEIEKHLNGICLSHSFSILRWYNFFLNRYLTTKK